MGASPPPPPLKVSEESQRERRGREEVKAVLVREQPGRIELAVRGRDKEGEGGLRERERGMGRERGGGGEGGREERKDGGVDLLLLEEADELIWCADTLGRMKQLC